MAHSLNEVPITHKPLQEDGPKVIRSNETELALYQPTVGNMAQLKPEALIKAGEQTVKQVIRSTGDVALEIVKTTESLVSSLENVGLDLVRMSIRTNNFIVEETGRTIHGAAMNGIKGTIEVTGEVISSVSQLSKTVLQEVHEVQQMNINLTRDLIGSLFRGFNPLKTKEKSSKKDATVIPITIQDN